MQGDIAMGAFKSGSGTSWIVGLLVGGALLWSTGARASDCAIGLTYGYPSNIDGLESNAEWSDATVLDSASPCFGQLMDYEKTNDSYPKRNVTVKSKRYQRDGNWYLGFLFEVIDSSNPVFVGEKIIMQFNRVINGDTKLNVLEDKRFTLTHHWSGVGNVVTDGSIEIAPPTIDGTCISVSTVDTKWGPPSGNGINFGIRKDVVGGGYRAEIEVPVSFVTGAAGDLPSDIGVAFAVVNDFGKAYGLPMGLCSVGAPACEAAAVSFPASLPETNDANPVDAQCDKGWVVPKQWGVGYRNSPPGQVTISRQNDWWMSKDIAVWDCISENYTFYPKKPCKATIHATVRNNGAATRRKILFLWAEHGTGDPTEYNFVDLKETVVAAGTPGVESLTEVVSDQWSKLPADKGNHPCVRVYIFPEELSTEDENRLRNAPGAVVTRDVIAKLIADYSREDQHWAQKNITRDPDNFGGMCPPENGENCGIVIGSLKFPRFELISTASASERVLASRNTTTGMLSGATARTTTGQVTPIPLSSGEWARYAGDHVIVRVNTVAHRSQRRGRRPHYDFAEDFGGVVHLFPVSLVQANGELPLTFRVSNGSDSRMRVKVQAATYVPPGVPGLEAVHVDLPESEFILEPHSNRDIAGNIASNEEHCPPHDHECKKKHPCGHPRHHHCKQKEEPRCNPFSRDNCKKGDEHGDGKGNDRSASDDHNRR
jgi:hypothetical protein